MTAEILSWSRSRGAFVGISLDGATLRGDTDENEAMYGKPMSTREVVEGHLSPTGAGQRLLAVLRETPHER